MSLQVTISRCSDCGWQGTPKRLWCPDCGTDQVREVAAESGRVAEITTVRRSAGREPARHVRAHPTQSHHPDTHRVVVR